MRKKQYEGLPKFSDKDNGLFYPMPIFVTKTNLRSILRENNVGALADLDKNKATSELRDSPHPK